MRNSAYASRRCTCVSTSPYLPPPVAGRSASATLDRHARELQTHLTPLALPGRPGRQLHTMLQDTQGHGSENNKSECSDRMRS